MSVDLPPFLMCCWLLKWNYYGTVDIDVVNLKLYIKSIAF